MTDRLQILDHPLVAGVCNDDPDAEAIANRLDEMFIEAGGVLRGDHETETWLQGQLDSTLTTLSALIEVLHKTGHAVAATEAETIEMVAVMLGTLVRPVPVGGEQ